MGRTGSFSLKIIEMVMEWGFKKGENLGNSGA